jgi:hypothetical protein
VKPMFDEAECLKTNPFEGDFGSPGDKVLKDKIVTARKSGTCCLCLQEIIPGERVRTLAAIFDGEMRSYRWCSECCEALAASWTDDGRAWEERVRIGNDIGRAL